VDENPQSEFQEKSDAFVVAKVPNNARPPS
jgi:hypothetical protein